MTRLYSLVLLALLVACALAAPHQAKKRSFKVKRVRQANYVANGRYQLLKSYRKFGISPISALEFKSKRPSTAVAASNSTGSGEGEVTATGVQNDAEFVSPVIVGGQSIVMDFDSGSSDMWVFNTNLAAADTKGHTVYDPTKSSTAGTEAGDFNIAYGDGSFANGPVGTDTVNIGGATVQTQVIGLPNNVSQSFVTDTSSNGLVGLAFSQLNTVRPTQAKTFFANVASSLETPVFTANFKNGTTGDYQFGAIDTTQFQGTLNQAAIDQTNGFWQFAAESFAVGNGESQATQSGTAIADTGTSLLIGDPNMVQAYYDQVDGAIDSEEVGGVAIPCNADLPDLQLAVGNSMATIPGSLMNFAQVGATNNQGQELCFGSLQSNGGSDLMIYGDIFMRANFVAFMGTDPPALGFAPHA